jgi:hypothetical protein
MALNASAEFHTTSTLDRGYRRFKGQHSVMAEDYGTQLRFRLDDEGVAVLNRIQAHYARTGRPTTLSVVFKDALVELSSAVFGSATSEP